MAKDRFHKFRATARNVGKRAGSARPYADLHGFVLRFSQEGRSPDYRLFLFPVPDGLYRITNLVKACRIVNC
jgi:hypothetical protein